MRKLLWIWIVLAAAGLALVYLASWLVALTSVKSLEYEGPCLWAAMELARGHNIYDAQRLTTPPWCVMIYTPLYFVLSSAFQHGTPDYMPMRAISMVSLIVTVVYFWRLLRLFYKDKLIVSTAVLAFASFNPLWTWSWKARVDMLSMAFSMMAIYYFATAFNKLKSQESSSGLMTILIYLPSALLSVAAIYTKQPSIVVPAVVCLFLLIKKRTFDLLIYVALCLVSGGPILAFLQVLTDGGFWAHMTFGSKMPFSVFDLEKHLSWIGADWPKLWLVGLLAIPWLIGVKRSKALLGSEVDETDLRGSGVDKSESVADKSESVVDKSESVVDKSALQARSGDDVVFALLLTAISGALTVYTLGTMYANLNHGLIFLIGCAWLVAIFLPTLPRLGPVLVLSSVVLSTVVMVTRLPALQNIKDSMGKYPIAPAQRFESRPQIENEKILVEDPQWGWELGAISWFVDPATFLQVWARDGRPLDDLIKTIEEQKFALVIINKPDSEGRYPVYFWNEDVMRAIRNNYKKVAEVVGNGELQDVYAPKWIQDGYAPKY